MLLCFVCFAYLSFRDGKVGWFGVVFGFGMGVEWFCVDGVVNGVFQVKRMVVSTYQAASGAGAAAMRELEQQTHEVSFYFLCVVELVGFVLFLSVKFI